MSRVTIDEVLGSEDWKGQDGTAMTSYKVRFTGDPTTTEAKLTRTSAAIAPYVGESFDGEVITKSGQKVLKKVKRDGGYTPKSNGSGKTGKTSDFRSPAQLMRGDAHGKALHWCDIKVAAGEWKPITWEQYIAMVDRFHDDLLDADRRLLDAGLRAELPGA